MKKILVVSDSHGSKSALENLIIENSFDYVFFLGDGIRDLEWLDEQDYDIYKVAGNCDYFSTEAKTRIVNIDGLRILLTHGDLFNVKLCRSTILTEAKSKNIDIVCFGHTHNQIDEIEEGIRFLNPGAFKNGHYMILELKNKHEISINKI